VSPFGQLGSARVTAIAKPGPRVDVLVRRIGPEGEHPAPPCDGPPGVSDPFRPVTEPGSRPTGIAAQMDRLDRGDDAEVSEPSDIRWVDELEMLDPVRQGRHARDRRQGVERRPDGRIADGVDRGRDPLCRCLACQPRHLVGCRRREAAQTGRRRSPLIVTVPRLQEERRAGEQ
jgi:hypothetical protein